ncbi:hypothetical protein [Desulfosporosinus sp. I2]|uniref:phospholipase D-like domain-containing protein n=1 Tax=Desulfosporosinus sp. I2 TaxID=1617025 RepID=UPI0032B7E771
MLIRPTRIKGHVRQWPNRKDVILQVAGVSLVFKSNIHQKYAVIDQRIVWYGSINLLSFGSAEESIMRLDSPNIANELVMSMDK